MSYHIKTSEEDRIGMSIVDCCLKVHKNLGPGLLEKIYEACLTHELIKLGHRADRQVNIPIVYDGIEFKEGLRLDILVDNKVIVEVKALDLINPVWEAQMISQLKLTQKKLGFLVNFNVPIIKQGIRRFIN